MGKPQRAALKLREDIQVLGLEKLKLKAISVLNVGKQLYITRVRAIYLGLSRNSTCWSGKSLAKIGMIS